MIIWRGWGGLAFGYAALAMIFFAGVASTLMPESLLSFSMAFGLLLAAVATWFTGRVLNQTSPQREVEIWELERALQLDELVDSGMFSLGPGQPQPQSPQEAREMADALFAQEQEQVQGLFNRHTLFWIPMQYWAIIWAAVAVFLLVLGILGLIQA